MSQFVWQCIQWLSHFRAWPTFFELRILWIDAAFVFVIIAAVVIAVRPCGVRTCCCMTKSVVRCPDLMLLRCEKLFRLKKKNSFDVKEMIEKPFFINCLFWEWGHHGLVLVLICLCRHQLKCLFFVLLWFLYWFCADSSTPRQHTGGELSLPRLRPVSVNR